MSTSRAVIFLVFFAAGSLTVAPDVAVKHPTVWWIVGALVTAAVASIGVAIVRHRQAIRDVWSNR